MDRAPSRKPIVARSAWFILALGLVVLVGSQVWVRHQNRVLSNFAIEQSPEIQWAKVRESWSAVVSVPPLAWPVCELLPGAALIVINPPGSGCEQVELTPRQLEELAFAGFAVTVGFGLDDGVRAALERRRGTAAAIVNLEAVVRSLGETIEIIDGHDHDDAGHPHDHAASDPHAWLDPFVMRGLVDEVTKRAPSQWQQTFTVVQGTSAAATPGASGNEVATSVPAAVELSNIEERAAKLRAICDQIDAEYRERLAPIKDKRIIVQHNAFSYLARRYGLTIEAVTRPRHDVEPTAGDLAAAARLLREKQARVIFVDPPGPDEATKRIAEAAGARVLVLDPLGDGDWPAMMRRNLDALVEGLTPKEDRPAP